jgi:hypothetical protein
MPWDSWFPLCLSSNKTVVPKKKKKEKKKYTAVTSKTASSQSELAPALRADATKKRELGNIRVLKDMSYFLYDKARKGAYCVFFATVL